MSESKHLAAPGLQKALEEWKRSESKHTPGPWEIYQKFPREVTLKRRHWSVGQGYGRGVAIVFGSEPGDDPSDANARLVAAAPDLFDACCDALAEALERDEDVGYGCWPIVIAAIERVCGEVRNG